MNLNNLKQSWPLPPADWPLKKCQIHVWSACLDVSDKTAARLSRLLSEREQSVAARFSTPKLRRRYAVGRGLLREMLGIYLQVEPAQVQFCYGAQGKPALAPTIAAGGLRFNLSHSGAMMLVGITRHWELGIDVEELSWLGESEDIVRRFFSPEEQSEFQKASVQDKQRVFFKLWTRREACLKCSGRGIARLEDGDGAPGTFSGVTRELFPSPDYIAAIAVEAEQFELETWRWPEPTQ